MDKILSFDIGGTSIKYGVLDLEGNILWKDEMSTEAHLGGNHIIEKVKMKIEQVIVKETVIGVAVSTAGVVDSINGVILEASDAIKGYKGQKIKQSIEETFNLKTTVENDVNCAALGEVWKGAGREKKNIFCITIGTGVGGCSVVDGKVLRGNSFSSGEIGYLNINGDDLNKTGSTSGMINRVIKRKNVNNNDINGKIVFDLAKQGDRICIEEIDTMVDNVSSAMAIIAYIVNPEVIILGGGVTKQKEYLLPLFKEKVNDKVIPYVSGHLDIKLAELENDAGIIGAVYNFINQR